MGSQELVHTAEDRRRTYVLEYDDTIFRSRLVSYYSEKFPGFISVDEPGLPVVRDYAIVEMAYRDTCLIPRATTWQIATRLLLAILWNTTQLDRF